MNPNPVPAQANLRPFKPGPDPGRRRSKDVERCFKMARRHSPEAMEFVIGMMRDPTEDSRVRLKAAEVIIAAARPKNPETLDRILGESGTTHLTIEFVNASKPIILEHQPADTPAQTNGHDAKGPLDIVFVGPKR